MPRLPESVPARIKVANADQQSGALTGFVLKYTWSIEVNSCGKVLFIRDYRGI
jgi:hypothetical protein